MNACLSPSGCCRVHRFDQITILFTDQLALELHGRRQLLVLRAELLLDQPELLDRLDPREAGVDLLVPADQRVAPDLLQETLCLEPPEDAEATEILDLKGDGGPVVRDKG